MNHLLTRLSLLLLAIIGLSQCSISSQVTPSSTPLDVKHIYIVRNDAVHMKGLLPEIVSQIQGMGYTVETVSAPPAGNAPYLTFTANWNWDFAMVLIYFHADLHRGNAVIGTAEYDSRRGGLNFSKYGHTAEKIRPLLQQLLGKGPSRG